MGDWLFKEKECVSTKYGLRDVGSSESGLGGIAIRERRDSNLDILLSIFISLSRYVGKVYLYHCSEMRLRCNYTAPDTRYFVAANDLTCLKGETRMFFVTPCKGLLLVFMSMKMEPRRLPNGQGRLTCEWKRFGTEIRREEVSPCCRTFLPSRRHLLFWNDLVFIFSGREAFVRESRV